MNSFFLQRVFVFEALPQLPYLVSSHFWLANKFLALQSSDVIQPNALMLLE